MRINRQIYLTKLIDRMNNGLIKVITGLRRVGKSYLLFNIFKDFLLSQGIDENHIIEIKFDQEETKPLLNHKKLLNFIYSKLIDKKNYYLLLDEVQNIKKFEPILIQLMRIENVDIYVTGSNSKFLSTDIDTSLNGKNDPIYVYPLSFNEFSSIYSDKKKAWDDFTLFGGLPHTLTLNNWQDKKEYISRTYNEVYKKDVVARYNIRSPELFSQIIQVLSSSIGSYISINNIVKTINSKNKVKIKYETIVRYLSHLKDAFLIRECNRYDLKGRKYIGANKKFYFEDLGIRNSIINFKSDDLPHMFENIVFNELIKHGYSVDIGIVPFKTNENGVQKIKLLETDFIASKYDKQYFIQACYHFTDHKVIGREIRSLDKIPSNATKIIITLDWVPMHENEKGILIYNFFDFVCNFFEKN